tara:strand:- start:4189 stop:4362 length:174 start_codon:yes stop_codon:yes gene_type:complete
MRGYKLQNHSIKLSRSKRYTVVDKQSGIVSSVIASGVLDALSKGRRLFNSTLVTLIS